MAHLYFKTHLSVLIFSKRHERVRGISLKSRVQPESGKVIRWIWPLQLWILRSLGIDIARAGILTVNKGYNYLGGDIDLEQYFNFTDCSEELDDLMTQAERAVETFNVILNKETPPEVRQGNNAADPIPVNFMQTAIRKHRKFNPTPSHLFPNFRAMSAAN